MLTVCEWKKGANVFWRECPTSGSVLYCTLGHPHCPSPRHPPSSYGACRQQGKHRPSTICLQQLAHVHCCLRQSPLLSVPTLPTTLLSAQRRPCCLQAGWHRNTALLRLVKIAPWGKWRALREALAAVEKQKAAFLESHGPFLYLAAIGTVDEARGNGLGSMLLDHLCREADKQQRFIYTEATSERGRVWLKRQGFFELLRHSVRPHAPAIYVMVRKPRAPGAPADQQNGSAGSKVQQQPLRPAGSVRTR